MIQNISDNKASCICRGLFQNLKWRIGKISTQAYMENIYEKHIGKSGTLTYLILGNI